MSNCKQIISNIYFNNAVYKNIKDGKLVEGFNGIVIFGNVSLFEVAKNNVQVHYTFINDYVSESGNYLPYEVSSGSKSQQYASSELLSSLDVGYAILEGSSNRYPFDEFKTGFTIQAKNTTT